METILISILSFHFEWEDKTISEFLSVLVNKSSLDKHQLDKIYHDGIDEWKKVIKVTKDKYPKE